jgi:hypothetical protein
MGGIGWHGSKEGIADPGDAPADAGKEDLVAEGTDGKHIVLGVENFVAGRHAYLRLGAASPRAGSTDVMLGEDLASLVHGFGDDTRDRGTGTEHAPAPAQAFDPGSAAIFAQTDGRAGVDPRRVESAILHTKGGWRDHSDGNRVTTTRGDKVEVIQGNYKLVVLGRQSAEGARTAKPEERAAARAALLETAAGLDFSGGVMDEAGDPQFASDADVPPPARGYDATTPDPAQSREQQGLATEYQWLQDSDGRWSWTITNTTGQPGGAGNYRVVNQSYVDRQEDHFGGGIDAKKVSNIVQRVWANEMFTMVTAGSTNTQYSGGTVDNGTNVWWLASGSVAALTLEVDVCAAIGLAQAGIIGSLAVGPAANVFLPFTTDFHIGPHIDTHAGAHMDAHAGLHQETRFGVHLEEHLGLHVDMHIGTHFDLDDSQVAFTAADDFRVHASSGLVDWKNASGGETKVSASTFTLVTPAQSLRIAANHSML